MKLYDIDEKILACVDQETGEIIDEEALAGLQLEKDRKIEGIACWVKDLTAEAKALKEEADNLKKRQKAAENKAESLKKFYELLVILTIDLLELDLWKRILLQAVRLIKES